MKKYPYFPMEDGLAYRVPDIEAQLRIIANRYIGDNAPLPYTLRAMPQSCFHQEESGDYRIDMAEKLGGGKDGYALVAGAISISISKEVNLSMACLGPCRLWLNGKDIFTSTFEDEIHREMPHRFRVTLPNGTSTIVILCRRTVAGFGCLIGLPPVTVCDPRPNANGAAGWIWTPLLDTAPSVLPSAFSQELWNLTWQDDFREEKNGLYVRWTQLRGIEGLSVTIHLHCAAETDCYVNGKKELHCNAGTHTLTAVYHAPMNIHLVGEGTFEKNPLLHCPIPAQGRKEPWLCAPLAEGEAFDYSRYTGITDAPWLNVRLFYEGAFSDVNWVKNGGSAFGSWNYPMGVTLQGLLRAADTVDAPEVRDYALSHMRQCLSYYEYACRDQTTYGATNINPELVFHANLDQFGSMGAAMLECARRAQYAQTDKLSAVFFDFICQRLPKLPDGTFYRLGRGAYEVDTIWADDLYMGTSFLIRYWQRYHDAQALEMAAIQFLHYAEYLMMPENIFSHVFDLTRKLQTGIPWGRGNGWTLFSLSELLEIISKDNRYRPQLLSLFCSLSDGYAHLQGKHGLWHQVLTDPDSYEEASCTAMFTYAMSKGLRNGWYAEPDKYFACVLKGWEAISTYTVDKDGNVHAVCKGSGFSFTKEYYADELFWITNDNHGVGIVLLAGSEVLRLLRSVPPS